MVTELRMHANRRGLWSYFVDRYNPEQEEITLDNLRWGMGLGDDISDAELKVLSTAPCQLSSTRARCRLLRAGSAMNRSPLPTPVVVLGERMGSGRVSWGNSKKGFSFRAGHIDRVFGNPVKSLQLVLKKLEERKAATQRGVDTRARRRESQINAVVKAIFEGEAIGPRSRCACCRKNLDDPLSIQRGIGPECYEAITQMVERERAAAADSRPPAIYG